MKKNNIIILIAVIILILVVGVFLFLKNRNSKTYLSIEDKINFQGGLSTEDKKMLQLDVNRNYTAAEVNTIIDQRSLLELKDSDHDGISDADELRFGLDPNNPDSNSDGRPDGQERIELGLESIKADPNSGLDFTDKTDVDQDFIPDVIEIKIGLDPKTKNTFEEFSKAMSKYLLSRQKIK